jgi:cellulose synthase/poly-beta-1,6-N-acetylglucosamine synthase-like glycosyltransferase
VSCREILSRPADADTPEPKVLSLMRLFVQIPCLNEEETLPLVLASIPKEIPGIDEIHILVVDDGSSDRTVEVARSLGVEHFVFHTRSSAAMRTS